MKLPRVVVLRRDPDTGVMVRSIDDDAMERLVAELTLTLNRTNARLTELEQRTFIETDIARPPYRIGAMAVVGTTIYVATGLTPADWTAV